MYLAVFQDPGLVVLALSELGRSSVADELGTLDVQRALLGL